MEQTPEATPVQNQERFVGTNPNAKHFFRLPMFFTNLPLGTAWFAAIVVLVLLAIIGGIITLKQTNFGQSKRADSTLGSPQEQPRLPVINPQSHTAGKYFLGNSQAIDFREEGSGGDFTLTLDRKNGATTLTWDNSIKATGIYIYNVGRLDDLTDHTVAFALSFNNPQAPTLQQPFLATSSAKQAAVIPPSPTSFIASPYTVGTIPTGYYDVTPQQQKGKAVFKKSARYSIEVSGLDKNNQQKTAYYTFTE